ncbi:MAG: catechol 2,3-dioxygenase-like lactoylglutathione lyase family enzyme [Neolewinella sp.]|jgi:catechol 2,3-dioxygenase-like lactoylglutathione lyase family enzyme
MHCFAASVQKYRDWEPVVETLDGMRYLATLVLAFGAASCGTHDAVQTLPFATSARSTLQLGNFSVSLAVKDIAVSKAFYQKLGFVAIGGEQAGGWLILRNGDTKVGLFQGMFPTNIMTFNPGWDGNAEALAEFVDVRDIQTKLEGVGIKLTKRAADGGVGPDSLTMIDPDGNVILIDQHVPRGK